MAKISNEKLYITKCQNGSRILFNYKNYRLLDGVCDVVNGEIVSYFLLIFDNKTKYIELTLKECYELLALYACEDVNNNLLFKKLTILLKNLQIL